MEVSRREFTNGAIAGAVATTFTLAHGSKTNAQSMPIRLPLHEFVENENLLKALRRGVSEMKARDPSDPLSWFYQAAIHGVTNRMVAEAARKDEKVLDFGHESFWNQCPHFGQNSANFLPWHRAYTHHFEEILRFHTGESSFALPYWDYSIESQRTFPREFGIQHLDGNPQNRDAANMNPLFHAERDFFLCGYEHPFTDQLPLTELSRRATDASRALATPVFFGDTEATGLGGGVYDNNTSTRGLLEQAPHDQIHRAVGGQVTGTSFPRGSRVGNPGASIGGMAIPMTAGFDPIFPVHHANMDRLWMVWSCTSGKSWGTLPSKTWFNERPWRFFDTNGQVVRRPRKDYFDHRALGVRFKDEDLSCTPLMLPEEITSEAVVALSDTPRVPEVRFNQTLSVQKFGDFEVSTETPTMLAVVPESERASPALASRTETFSLESNHSGTSQIILRDVEIETVSSNGFDVYLLPSSADTSGIDNSNDGYLGTINLFVHSIRENMKFDQTFDATRAIQASGTTIDDMQVVFIPFQLTTRPNVDTGEHTFSSGSLKATSIEFTTTS